MESIHLLLAFVISLAVLIVMILSQKFNPSLCLFVSALVAAIISRVPLESIATTLNDSFGSIIAATGFVIIFAMVFAQYLQESGAMQELAKGMVRVITQTVGIKYDLIAFAIIGYLMCIPVGIVGATILVVPLLRPISKLTGRPIPAYLCAFIQPALLTNCTVVPTSIIFAGLLDLDVGAYMLWGIVATLPGAVVSTLCAYAISAYYKKKESYIDEENAESLDLTRDPTKPGAGMSIMLLLLPTIIIATTSILNYVIPAGTTLAAVNSFIGAPTIALFITALITMFAVRKYLPRPSAVVFNEAFKESGPLLAMVGCANAYSAVLLASGIGNYIMVIMSSLNLSPIWIALLLIVVMHMGTGAGTVAAIAAASLLRPLFEATAIPLMLLGLLCGVCQVILSIPTDMFFWMVKDATRLKVRDVVIGMTIPATVAGVACFIFILVLSPFVGSLPGM